MVHIYVEKHILKTQIMEITMTKTTIYLPDNIMKEIRKEAFERTLTVTQLLPVLVKLGLDVYTGKVEVISTVEPGDDWLDDD